MRPRPISLWTQCHASAVFLVGDTSSQASLFLVIRLTCEAYQKGEVFKVVADIEPRFGRLDCESQKLRTSLSTSLVANLQAFTGSLKAVLEFLSTYIFSFSASRGGSKMSDKQVAYFQLGPSNYLSLAVLPPAGLMRLQVYFLDIARVCLVTYPPTHYQHTSQVEDKWRQHHD